MSWGLIDKTLEGRQSVFFPHWFRRVCPTEGEANLAYRQRIRATSKLAERKQLYKWASEDFLFYCYSFLYVFLADPKEDEEPGPVAFNLYDYQVELATGAWALLHEGERGQGRFKKPRRMGLTWLILSLLEHCWHFRNNRHILIGSAREEEVDSSMRITRGKNAMVGQWSKLLPKVDWLHLTQPRWMLPEGYRPREEPWRTSMQIVSPGNSIIWGTSKAGIAGRSERGAAVFWDEAAHTDTLYEIIGALSKFSPTKFWVSSIGNLDHAFSTILRDEPIKQFPIAWWMHPEYSKDMTINPETGAKTSPWLEKACAELGNDPVLCNREYLADEKMQIGGFYPQILMEKVEGTEKKAGTIMPPIMRGEFDILDGPDGKPFVARFVEQVNGSWDIWMHLGRDGKPSRATRYIIGIDTAAGSQDHAGRGASNSVIAVCDWTTGDIVAELATSKVTPDELAKIAYAVGNWFEGEDFGAATIIPEINGPGGEFVTHLARKMKYPNVWIEKRNPKGEPTYGWHKNINAGESFGLHRTFLMDGTMVERSKWCAEEMRHYQHNPTGKGAPIHAASVRTDDPSGARDNHGDRVIARVVICHVLDKWQKDPPSRQDSVPRGSYAYFENRRERDRNLLKRI